jgi:hypothetical protein
VRSRALWGVAVLCLIGVRASFAVAQQAQAPAVAGFKEGQSVEVREGDEWSSAKVTKREGRKYQIKYDDGTEEWVAADRVRAAGAGGPTAKPAPSAKPAPTVKADVAKPDAEKPEIQKPKKTWNVGQKVQTKWGGLWFDAKIEKKAANGWYMVQYEGHGKQYEWVEPWRLRAPGSTVDDVGYARPGTSGFKPIPAPTTPPGEATEPIGAARAHRDEPAPKEWTEDPAYKEADWADADVLDLTAPSGAWKLQPDAGPGGSQRQGGPPVALKGAGNEFFDRTTGLVVGHGAAANLAVLSHGQLNGRQNETKLEVVDLAAGKSLWVIPAGDAVVPLDLSADGTHLITRNDKFGFGESKRIDVWQLPAKGSSAGSAKREVLFVPNGGDQNVPDRDIAFACFVGTPGDPRVLTISKGGKLGIWDPKTAKATRSAAVGSGHPALSAGGKQLAIGDELGITILDTTTLKVLAAIPYTGAKTVSLAFSPSGRQLAAYGGNGFISVWDLTTGQLTREFSVRGVKGESFDVVADGYAMIGDDTLIDFNLRVPLWHYTKPEGAGAVTASGSYVFAAIDKQSKIAQLGNVLLPHEGALALAKTLSPDRLLLLKPGMSITLEVSVDGPEDARQKIESHLKSELASRQIGIAPNQPVKLVASTAPGKTQERAYRRFGESPWGGGTKVNVTQQIAKLEVLTADGKVAWSAQAISDPGFMLMLKENQSIEQAVAEASKPNLMFFQTVKVPATVTVPREPAWYGSGALTPRGAQNTPAPQQPAGAPF